MKTDVERNLRYNFTVGMFDGAFFGLALGLASYVTMLPLFVSTMTNSAILIGLIPAIRTIGWQLPQLLTARRVARLRRYKSMAILMTIHERLPILGLALIAWFLPTLGSRLALWLTFGMLVWHGLGGGFAATAWLSMIGKIIPEKYRGTFFGAQSGAANLLASGGALLAGFLLERGDLHLGFTYSFLLASGAMVVSWFFVASTRESDNPPEEAQQPALWQSMKGIFHCDANFRYFLAARLVSPLGSLAFGFYTVYLVQRYHISGGTAGLMTSVFMMAQVIANPLMGWLGDRVGHRVTMEAGALAAAASALLAWWAPSASWFYLAFILAGVALVALWTCGLAMTLEFGSVAERPVYVGMANTLVVPSTIVAPILGGWLADMAGYQATFLFSAAGAFATAAIFRTLVRNPRTLSPQPCAE
ncbi:MAG: MFS transporter [Thermoflexales bacterium]|nr:MFS transporter [Thermoflexales bacterium]